MTTPTGGIGGLPPIGPNFCPVPDCIPAGEVQFTPAPIDAFTDAFPDLVGRDGDSVYQAWLTQGTGCGPIGVAYWCDSDVLVLYGPLPQYDGGVPNPSYIELITDTGVFPNVPLLDHVSGFAGHPEWQAVRIHDASQYGTEVQSIGFFNADNTRTCTLLKPYGTWNGAPWRIGTGNAGCTPTPLDPPVTGLDITSFSNSTFCDIALGGSGFVTPGLGFVEFRNEDGTVVHNTVDDGIALDVLGDSGVSIPFWTQVSQMGVRYITVGQDATTDLHTLDFGSEVQILKCPADVTVTYDQGLATIDVQGYSGLFTNTTNFTIVTDGGTYGPFDSTTPGVVVLNDGEAQINVPGVLGTDPFTMTHVEITDLDGHVLGTWDGSIPVNQ